MKNWPVLRLLAFDHCRSLAPWCAVRRARTPLLQARRIAHELEQAQLRPPGVVEAGLAQLLYPVSSWRQIWLVWSSLSRAVRRHYGVSRRRQLRDLLTVVWRANLPPRVYYFQRLFRHPHRETFLAVIDHRELQALLRDLHAGVDTTVLDDKAVFHDFCVTHGLPTPAIVACYRDGHAVISPSADEVLKADLFSKPARSHSSHGIACWRYDPATDTHTDGKVSLNRSALHQWLSAQSVDSCVIVQKRQRNSVELAPISAKALANCRVVTARRPDGSLMVLLAALRLGAGNALTSDEPDNCFCTAVERQTGRLGLAESKKADRGSFTHHPDSQAAITGQILSHWPEMQAMALKAHSHLPQMVFVGWDVVDTEHGPMLLEGNVVWGGNLAQMSGNPPLGKTEFPDIYLQQHARIPRTKQPARAGDAHDDR